MGSWVKGLEQSYSDSNKLSQEDIESLCTAVKTSENASQLAAKLLEVKELDKCIQYERILQTDKSASTLRHRKHVYLSKIMKKITRWLKIFQLDRNRIRTHGKVSHFLRNGVFHDASTGSEALLQSHREYHTKTGPCIRHIDADQEQRIESHPENGFAVVIWQYLRSEGNFEN